MAQTSHPAPALPGLTPPAKAADSAKIAPRIDSAIATDSAALDSASRDSAAIDSLAPKPRRSFKFYEIDDADLIAQIWTQVGRDSAPDEGRYQLLQVTEPGDTVSHAYLMREGTQVGRIPDSLVEALRAKVRLRSNAEGQLLSQNLAGNFWNPANPLQPYQWRTGLSVEAGMAGAVFGNSSPQLEEHFDIGFAQRPVRWVTVEVGAHFSRYGGGLQRNLRNPNDTASNFSYYERGHYEGRAAIGVPGVKWEVAMSDGAYPEYYWLDARAGSGAYMNGRERSGDPVDSTEGFNEARLLRRWRGGREPGISSNLAQTLHVKLGQIRYTAVFDRDVYASTIHQIMFDELPAPFGEWGIGMLFAEASASTRFHFDLFPLTLGVPGGRATSFQMFLLRFDLALRDSKTFRAGVSTLFSLDGPTLRPGGNP